MAFLVYNTDDPNATAMGYTQILASGSITVPTASPTYTPGAGAPSAAAAQSALRTDVNTRIAGSFFCDQAGTLVIQQSFDYLLPGGAPNPSPNFDVINYAVGLSSPGTTVGGTKYNIDCDVIAPWMQVVFTNTSVSTTTHVRLFVRVFSMGGRG